MAECSAYDRNRLVCRNGFPQRMSCWDGQGWSSPGNAPHCMDDDYAPPHIISADTGLPMLAEKPIPQPFAVPRSNAS